MRILQINKFFYPKGGSEKYFFDLIGLLEKNGHEVMVFSMHHPQNKKSPDSKYFISQIDYSNQKNLFSKTKNFLVNPEAAVKLEELIKNKKPDVAHLHNIHHQLTPIIAKVLKKHNIPMVQTLHDYQVICPNYLLYTKGRVCQRCRPQKYYHCFLNRCVEKSYLKSFLASIEMHYNRRVDDYLKNIDLLISPSKFLKKTLEDWGVSNKIVHLPNFTSIKPLADIKQKDYYLYFGRLSKEKGLHTLIKAFNKLDDQLIIAGTGPLKIKAAKNIKSVGFKSGDELTRLIQESKAVIIPSEWYENNPLSALEALALQKPVIAANIGGLPELTKNLFTPGNVEELVDLIKSNQCNQHLISAISVSTHYQELIKIYEEVINNN